MNEQEVQYFASQNELDVRPLAPWHFRLTDQYEKYLLDVYFKKNKRGEVIKNTVFVWVTGRWTTASSRNDLKRLITQS